MRLLDCYMPFFIKVLQVIEEQKDDIETVRKQLQTELITAQDKAHQYGYDQHDIDEAHFAVVVWADETILCAAQGELHQWRQLSLQMEHYDSALGGDTFFKRLGMLEPENYQVKLVYLFCLLCGFRGRYSNDDNQELNNIIKQLLNSLPDRYRNYLTSQYSKLMMEDEVHESSANRRPFYIKIMLFVVTLITIYILITVYLLNIA